MKGLISGIKRMEIHDGDGLRTTVFFKGCPLKCIWCHNPESISYKPQTAYFADKCIYCNNCKGEKSAASAEVCPVNALVHYGTEYSAEQLYEIIMQDALFFKSGNGGVTLSGGECLTQIDFTVKLARLLKENGISVYIDTCGYVPKESIERIIPYTDKFLYDIKAIDSSLHRECTGKDNSLILDNLKFITKSGISTEIRYPLISGLNDGECVKIGQLLSGMDNITKVKVLMYHSLSASRYKALGMNITLPDMITTHDDVEKAVKTLKSFGLNASSE